MKINKLVFVGLLVGIAVTLVADTVVYPRGFASEMSSEGPQREHWEAADECSEMEPKGTWRLPTVNEVIVLCDSVHNDCGLRYLWTSKRLEIVSAGEIVVGREEEGGYGAWLALRPTTHEWTYGWFAKVHYYRCVK
jgi:hypothetical protein